MRVRFRYEFAGGGTSRNFAVLTMESVLGDRTVTSAWKQVWSDAAHSRQERERMQLVLVVESANYGPELLSLPEVEKYASFSSRAGFPSSNSR